MEQIKTNVRNHSHKTVLSLSYAAMTAALYVLFTYLAQMLGIASGAIQVRISEALTILPALLPGGGGIAAIFGLFTGCMLSNLLTGCAFWDIIFGSLATLLGAIGTYFLRKHPALIWIPPVIANIVIVPQVLIYVYGDESALGFLMFTVGIGEVLSCGMLGMLLYTALKRRFLKSRS